MQKEGLLEWAGAQGFITQWHVYGPFESGLERNPSPNLFDLKHSKYWGQDHLESIGGIKSLSNTGNLQLLEGEVSWKWEVAQPLFSPELKLAELKEYYPEWETRLKDIDTNGWSNLYYALAILDSPEDVDAMLYFCGWDGCRLWINGEFVFEEHSYHKSIYEKEKVKFKLKKGNNQILFQLDRDGLVARLEVLSNKISIHQIQSLLLKEKPLKRKISTFYQLHEGLRRKTVTHRYPGKKYKDVESWKAEMLSAYHSCLGEGPETECNYGNVRLLNVSEKEKYFQEEYIIEAEASGEMPCVLLKPKKDLFNGIALVLLHGHVGNYRTLLGEVKPTGPRLFVNDYRGDYAKRMAEKGFMVATYCERGFSVRNDLFQNVDPCNKAQMMCAAMGLQLPRLHIADIHLVYQLLADQNGVNKNKIGISGLSGGGTLSYLTAAYDEKFKAVAAFCCICSYKDYAYGDGCGLQVVNGWYPKADLGDILGLIAPRPLLIGQGLFDTTFNSVRAKEAYSIAKGYYSGFNKLDNVQLALYPLAHEYEQDLAEEFFLMNLG